MMDRIVMEVSRYRPEIESAPTFQAYEVPLTREWAVLDGLTYIKDHLDGTLSFRWSCRMGICGSWRARHSLPITYPGRCGWSRCETSR